jgi:SAM-dependent methyltransferase
MANPGTARLYGNAPSQQTITQSLEYNMSDYLDANLDYWKKGYDAANVESFVFRVHGRILRDLIPRSSGRPAMLDFGCGAGATCGYYRTQGFDVYGVDISEIDIERCRKRIPDSKNNFLVIAPKPTPRHSYFGRKFELITSIQSFYYLDDDDMRVCAESIHDQLQPGGLFYVTMMGERNWFFNYSTPVGNGLHRVEFDTPRLKVKDYYVNFTRDEAQLRNRFPMFEPLHIGYYDACYREDEGSDFHFTFVGRRR